MPCRLQTLRGVRKVCMCVCLTDSETVKETVFLRSYATLLVLRYHFIMELQFNDALKDALLQVFKGSHRGDGFA